MEKKKSILLAAVAVSMLMTFQPAKAANVGSWTDLQQAIVNGTTPIDITGDITAGGNLGTLGGSNNTVTINGNGFNINGNGHEGITVNSGQTLNVNNVGNSADENSNGFNGFQASSGVGGGAIYNNGTITIENSTLSRNSAHSGGAITNASNASLTINNALFASNNAADCGGAIINNSGDLVITNSTFIGNSANSWGGALYNNIAETTIIDSSFYGNSGSAGGAITSIGTLNIIADSKNVEFTGNTRGDGTSNAIHSFNNTINLNAGDSASVVFNDAISVHRGTNIININSNNVQINSDLNSPVYAQTTGTVEINNKVEKHTVNLYDGTLKLGHYEGGTIDVNGTQQTVAESVGSFDSSVNFNVHGGTLSLQDGGARTTNIGKVTLENDLQLAIDAASGTDMITANSFNADGHKILISDINLGSEISYAGTAVSTDSNIYNNVGLSSDIKLSGDGLANTNSLISYDNTTGTLTAGASSLAQAVANTAADRVYVMDTNENVASNLGSMGGGSGATLTINGGGHNITATNGGAGISVNRRQTLNVNNVGNSADENSKGFNGFSSENTAGTVISGYYGNINVNNSVFSGNKAYTQGGVIDNYYGDVTVKNSVFIGNSSEFQGGAIGHTGGNAVIKGSSFINNSTGTSGGAISVVYDEAIITDSTFTGNSAERDGGAIWNCGTVNIIADAADTTFTGNTANGVSNALYNELSTININATGEHRVVFNDGIDGNSSSIADNIININNTGVKMADGTTDAPTTGIVEFNNTVKNNTVNLYDDTLKLGTHTYTTEESSVLAGQTGYGSLDSSVDFNVYGGTLSLQDGGARTTNIGNVTLENDLQLAIDADLANSKSDMITGNLVKANDNNIVISDVNILSDSTVAILETQVADDNLKSVVELATDAQISKEAGVNKNYLLSYDNTDGMLEFNSIVDLKAAVDATDSSRVYNMSTDENVTQYLGSMGGTNSTLTINGGGHDIKGNGNRGITVNSGQTLNVNNVGSEGSDGFNGFVYSQGGAIDNRGTATITGSTFTGNTSGRNGGAIGNIAIATITDSTFTGNLAAYGGAIFNSDNTATTTISDSTFTGNSAGYGGAIFNNLGTVNIIANESDTTFTGNTANGVSNALYNLNYDVDAVANINAAGEHRVVFNDGIDGEGFSIAENIININNTGVKMADGTTDAPTSGVVEFNNTVKNNTVNLYNGTLKLGTHTYTTEESSVLAGQTGYGSLDSSVDFNVYGGTLSLQDGGARTTNIGNVTLENDLQLAIDANLAGDSPQADKITGRLTADNGHNIIISDVNIIQGADAEGVVNTVVADSNLKDAVILATDAEVTLPEDDTKSYLLAYNSSDSEGVLTFDSRDNLINAIKRTDEQRNYVMNADENVTENLGVIGGDGSTLSINGNGHNIIAELDDEGYNQYSGITVNDGQTLSINNVGTQTSQGFTGFTSENGAAIDNNGTLNITNSVFTNNLATTAGGAIYNTNELNITDSIFNENAAGGDGGAIYNDHGVVNIIASESNTEFTGNGGNNVPNALHNAGGTVNLNADEHNITFNDSISGGDSGIININADSSVTGLTDAPTSGIIAINNEVKNNTVNMYNGTLNFGTNTQYGTLYSGTFADSVNFNYNGGTVSLQNGGINSANLGNLTLNSDMDLRLDANLANQTMDTITASGFTNNSGHNINISNILITEPTTEKSFSISPLGTGMDDSVRSALAGAIRYTGGDITYSPIYKYSASYDPATAMMNFGLYGGGGGGGYDSYNPDIFAAPVAAQLGGYLVQLNSYDNAFRNMDMYMLMTKEQRQAMKFRNKYATTNKDIVFDPTITQYENKAGWFRPYATFENVSLNNGPDVSNVAYGSFFGAESELYDLGHGWDGMWGVYAGYNGSHQAYDGVSIYQNGGTFGAVGMAYKGNFFTGLTANVGASAGDASTMFGREDFTMLMSGIASKTGYNYELAEGKFIIQPSLLMSYSFINTFDYTNAAGVSISSDPLHAIQLEPGVKFIGNLKNGWQPYASVSVIWNIMDRTHFKANDVSLPNLSVDPFVKYGVGVRKSWGERFTGFFQTYITNGGRNGVGLQAGFRWTLGKSEPKQQKANGKIPELPKTQITLNNIR